MSSGSEVPLPVHLEVEVFLLQASLLAEHGAPLLVGLQVPLPAQPEMPLVIELEIPGIMESKLPTPVVQVLMKPKALLRQ